MARPTMADVAARAGVSRALVSLVMRDSPKVSAHRRRAVLAAAEDLGYRPHAMARSLASGVSDIVGVMVSDLRNPFFAEVVEGMDDAAQEAGLHLVLNTGRRSAVREQAALDSLLAFRPGGVILLSPVLPAAAIRAAAQHGPVVLVSRGSTAPGVDTVNDDGVTGAGLAVDHLAALGHRRIVHLDGGAAATSAARRRGYREAMSRHGLAPMVVPSEHTDAAGASAVQALLNLFSRIDFPTALVCGNDFNALGAIAALREAGLRVPDDVSVVGYDNTSIAAMPHPALTTVDQPRNSMGRLAIRALTERLREGRTTATHHRVEPSLVVRATSAAPRSPNRGAIRANPEKSYTTTGSRSSSESPIPDNPATPPGWGRPAMPRRSDLRPIPPNSKRPTKPPDPDQPTTPRHSKDPARSPNSDRPARPSKSNRLATPPPSRHPTTPPSSDRSATPPDPSRPPASPNS
ncbi:LacI family DNA-binding transcriptional regulator [Nocardia bovistercoris]|uniref:Substrate-binding domain-containing protein n=1 Tax=Nocardia bovistercoris TaxID=2785916 RepID=A0A931II25_9NOCA|nr:LacI family DNA-binding transcriptional regulator [Nocardia bovistercoris]MBH0781829.1 substrate-binding domain-containing protein [Nocardia bovistercoris]